MVPIIDNAYLPVRAAQAHFDRNRRRALVAVVSQCSLHYSSFCCHSAQSPVARAAFYPADPRYDPHGRNDRRRFFLRAHSTPAVMRSQGNREGE